MLLDRLRLTRQRRLFDLQIDALDQTQIRWHIVPGLQQDDVARHDLAPGNRQLLAVADDLRLRRGHLLQRRQRLLCLGLLNHTHHGVEQHDKQNGDRVDVLTKRQRHHGGNDQDDHQKILELVPQQTQKARSRSLGQFIGAKFCQPLLRLRLSQAALKVRLQVTQQFFDRFAVGLLVMHIKLPGT